MYNLKKLFISLFILLSCSLLIISNICFSYSTDSFIWSNNLSSITTSSNSYKEDNTNFLNLVSQSAILIEQNTGQILYEYNSHEQLRPASVTKVMSILLIMEALDSGKISLTDKVSCSQTAANMGGSQIWLDVREKLTVDEMLKAICVASANDCTVAMAEYLEGSTSAFVKKMNEKAKLLGMNDTCFKNCHGLDEDGHVTSSYDIALMSKELLANHPNITKYTTIWMDTLRDGKSQLTNTNKLIRNYSGCTGLKTGSTNLALYNLSASATRDGLSLIAVIMKAPSPQIRFSEAEKLLDYGFNTYSYENLATRGTILKNLYVEKGTYNNVNIVFENNCGVLIKKGADENIEKIINIPNSISAPIYAGQKIGEISYILNEEIIAKTNLVVETDIKKISIPTLIKKIIFSWLHILY